MSLISSKVLHKIGKGKVMREDKNSWWGRLNLLIFLWLWERAKYAFWWRAPEINNFQYTFHHSKSGAFPSSLNVCKKELILTDQDDYKILEWLLIPLVFRLWLSFTLFHMNAWFHSQDPCILVCVIHTPEEQVCVPIRTLQLIIMTNSTFYVQPKPFSYLGFGRNLAAFQWLRVLAYCNLKYLVFICL